MDGGVGSGVVVLLLSLVFGKICAEPAFVNMTELTSSTRTIVGITAEEENDADNCDLILSAINPIVL